MKFFLVVFLFLFYTQITAQTLGSKIIELDTILVKGQRKRIVFSGDTLIIRTNDLITKPHADASDIFNQIPGLNIDNNNVFIFGNVINQLTVDGKNIFGGVPIITLNSLKASMIQQIEIIEKINEFGTIEKTVNLKLKENRNKGGFGELALGGGSKHRNSQKVKYNKLGTNSYSNFFFNSNNLNEVGLNLNDIEKLTNGIIRNQTNNKSILGLYDNETYQNSENLLKLQNNNTGISSITDGGFNYTYSKKQNEINSFLLFTRNNQLLKITQTKESFWENNTQYLNTISTNNLLKDIINFNVNGKIQVSKKSIFKFSEQIIFEHIDTKDSTWRVSRINENENEVKTNRIGNQISFFHNFQGTYNIQGNKKGVKSTFFLSIKNKIPKESTIFSNEIKKVENITNQSITEFSTYNHINFEYIYSIPVFKKFLVEAKFNHLTENVDLTQNQQNLSAYLGKNENIGNLFSLKNKKNELGLYTLYQQRNWSFVNGLSVFGYNSERLKSENETKNIHLNSLNFISRLNFKLTNKTRVYLRYQKKPVLPSWESIGEIADSSYTEKIKVGNFELKPYLENASTISINHSLKDSYLLNLNLSRKTYDKYFIENTIINDWIQSMNQINSIKPVKEFSLSYSVFQLNAIKKISFSVFGNFIDLKSQTLLNENYFNLKTQLFFNNIQVNYRFNKTNNLKSTLQIYSNWVNNKNSNQLNFNVNNSFVFYKNWYFDNNLRVIFSQTPRVFFDAEVQRYILKNNIIRCSLIVKNALNTTLDTKISMSNNEQIFTSYNYLPRFAMLKFTFFFEKWSKAKNLENK